MRFNSVIAYLRYLDLLHVFLIEVATESVEDLPNQTGNKFVPNFIKNPDFHYSNKTYTGLYNDSNSTTKIGNDDNKNKESFTSPTPDPSCKKSNLRVYCLEFYYDCLIQ